MKSSVRIPWLMIWSFEERRGVVLREEREGKGKFVSRSKDGVNTILRLWTRGTGIGTLIPLN